MTHTYNIRLFRLPGEASEQEYQRLVKNALEEDILLCFENVFCRGDIHHGMSDSRLMDAGLDLLCELDPDDVILIADLIPDYASWKNTLVLLHHEKTREKMIQLALGRINADINLIQERRPSSSFACDMPDGSTEDGKILANAFHLNVSSYDSLMNMLKEKAYVEKVHSDFPCRDMTDEEVIAYLHHYERIRALFEMR